MAVLQVVLRLSYPDIIMQPNAADMKKALARLALRIMESSKPFVRWMDGTCLEAQPIHGQSSLCHLPCSFCINATHICLPLLLGHSTYNSGFLLEKASLWVWYGAY